MYLDFFLHGISILVTHILLLGLSVVELKCSHRVYMYIKCTQYHSVNKYLLNIKGNSSADINCRSTNDVSRAVFY